MQTHNYRDYQKRRDKFRGENTLEEDFMLKERREYMVVIAFTLVLIMFVAFAFYWDTTPHRVKDVEVLAELEAADPEYYADIKADLAELVSEEQDVAPERIVFRVDIQSYLYELFEVKIWYKVESGEWYRWDVGWLSIPNDLESTLIREFINPNWEG